MLKKGSPKEVSSYQERHIAKILKGKVTPASGGTKYSGGDVHTDIFLIEAKAVTGNRESFSIKKDWISKARIQAFEQGKKFGVVAFQFDKYDDNFFVIDEALMRLLVEHMEGRAEWQN